MYPSHLGSHPPRSSLHRPVSQSILGADKPPNVPSSWLPSARPANRVRHAMPQDDRPQGSRHEASLGENRRRSVHMDDPVRLRSAASPLEHRTVGREVPDLLQRQDALRHRGLVRERRLQMIVERSSVFRPILLLQLFLGLRPVPQPPALHQFQRSAWASMSPHRIASLPSCSVDARPVRRCLTAPSGARLPGACRDSTDSLVHPDDGHCCPLLGSLGSAQGLWLFIQYLSRSPSHQRRTARDSPRGTGRDQGIPSNSSMCLG